MKRSKIILLVTTLVLSAILLSSCAANNIAPVKDISKVLNVDYDLSSDPYKTGSELAGLVGTITDLPNDSDEFMIFELQDDQNPDKLTYKVLSLRSDTVILEFTTDENTSYSFEPIVGFPALLVTKTVTSEDFTKTPSFYLYDATSQLIAASETESAVSSIADLLIYDYVAYKVESNTGKLVKETDIPEYMSVENIVDYNDNYFYAFTEIGVTVYDRSFNRVSSWTATEFDDDSIYDGNFHILNNGDMIVQYFVILDEDASKYDLTVVEDDKTMKIDLVSTRISAKNGKAKDLNLKYVIDEVIKNTDLYDKNESADKNYFVDTFENIALIRPIVDKKLLSSDANKDIVLMNNKVKLGKSLKIADNQAAEIPAKIADGLYSVTMLDGGVSIIDAKGNIIRSMNNPLTRVGSYFVGNRAVYDMELKSVYDLSKKDVELYATLGDTILIKSGTDEEYSIISLRNGEEKTLYTHAKDATSEFGLIADSIYYTKDSNGNYSYYNEAGTNLANSTKGLVPIHTSAEHGKIILTYLPNDLTETEKVRFFVFSK